MERGAKSSGAFASSVEGFGSVRSQARSIAIRAASRGMWGVDAAQGCGFGSRASDGGFVSEKQSEACTRQSPTRLAHPLEDDRAVMIHVIGPSLQG